LEGVSYTVLVEPQDYGAYLEHHPAARLCKLPYNNRGLAYARQVALQLARKLGYDWYWMLDDDIKGFYYTKNEKTWTYELPEKALEDAEWFFLNGDHIGQAGLEYQQYAWSNKRPFVMNSYCDVAVCIRTAMPVNYRTELPFKSDRDFTLQILSIGYKVIKLAQISFAVPKNGSNKGGLYDQYKTEKEAAASRRMVELWGDHICQVKMKKDGRPDVKINWRAFDK